MPVIGWEELTADAGAALPAGTKAFVWPKTGATFADGDTGLPLPCSQYELTTVQVRATAFNAGTVTLRGACHPQAASQGFDVVHDVTGAPIAFTANGLARIVETPFALSPIVAGGAPTALQILVHCSTTARR